MLVRFRQIFSFTGFFSITCREGNGEKLFKSFLKPLARATSSRVANYVMPVAQLPDRCDRQGVPPKGVADKDRKLPRLGERMRDVTAKGLNGPQK